MRCAAYTQSGKRCSRKSVAGSKYCAQHASMMKTPETENEKIQRLKNSYNNINETIKGSLMRSKSTFINPDTVYYVLLDDTSVKYPYTQAELNRKQKIKDEIGGKVRIKYLSENKQKHVGVRELFLSENVKKFLREIRNVNKENIKKIIG